MRAARNIAIIALLALLVAVVPGGDNASEALLTAINLAFLTLIGLGAYQLARMRQLDLMTLSEGQRTLLLTALGVIVLMIAGIEELLGSGPGTVLWLVAIAASIFALYRVWTESRSAY